MKKAVKPQPNLKPNMFQPTFVQLKKVLRRYEQHLIVTVNTSDHYSLNTAFSPKYKKEIFFGAARIQKNYISYHLMAIYAFPAMLKHISPALEKRRQGKSCFNFTTIDGPLLAELTALTKTCFKKFENAKMIYVHWPGEPPKAAKQSQ